MLCVTPGSSESSVGDSGPALQVNAVKVPSSLMLTELFKVRSAVCVPCLHSGFVFMDIYTFMINSFFVAKFYFNISYILFVISQLCYICQHLMVTARRFTVIIEEKLLLKLLAFFGYGQTEGCMKSSAKSSP